jgi:hypothetical protein
MSTEKFTLSGDAAPSKKQKQLAAARRWRARNKDKVAAYNKEWNAANKKDWYQENKERVAAYEKLRKDADPEKFKADAAARMRKWRRQNREKYLATQKVYSAKLRREQPEKIKRKKKASYERNATAISTRHRCRKYGLAPSQLAAMIDECKGHCPQCKTQFGDTRNTRPCIDHCHKSTMVRGILCGRCNLLLGLARDNPDILRKLIVYLEKAHLACG